MIVTFIKNLFKNDSWRNKIQENNKEGELLQESLHDSSSPMISLDAFPLPFQPLFICIGLLHLTPLQKSLMGDLACASLNRYEGFVVSKYCSEKRD